MQIIAIAAGGAVGAVMRYILSNAIYSWLGRGFPWGTLTVNTVGSLLMGLLFVLLTERLALGPQWRAFLVIGMLGAFTTFSTFSMETLNLIESGELLRAMLNMVGSVVICVGAAWLGVIIGRMS
ncbi:MAG: fluoride efflux transporter CrcB [Thiotrichales bacterium]|jgi:CrcB protein|nr:fluoride efflux transporter CrcB [Thiotrichales bacterium]MBT3612773.1 fluoride efflux transporter CrcB [Thiotrichales bacterium]MBT3753149.1 fluoride efflux transporter CrcB [Thiotrichales bacterium]MBT3837294.1 fluoride efflux transporter CrcB [Thiotrichales bacterium]MBT4151858.1 fluoride efflux transporter CrcB [Thiotrichales bacterium]